jgi:hypothetical protein
MTAARAYALLLAAVALALGLLAYISYVVFQAYPLSQDEYSNIYQAYIFSQGRAWLDIDMRFEPLIEQYMILYKDRLFSKYPPGAAVMLVPGVMLGIPWIINPLISTANVLVLLATLRQLVSPAAAFTAIFLLITNSYFLGYGASYFPQPLSLLMCSIGFWSMLHYMRAPTLRNLALPGIIISLYVFVRPLDAFCLLLASGIALLHRPLIEQWKKLLVLGILAACGIFLMFLMNYWLSDCFCIATYPIWNNEFRIIDHKAISFLENVNSIFHEQLFNYIKFAYPNFIRWFLRFIGLPFLVLALAGMMMPGNPLKRMCLVMMFLLVTLYNFHGSLGWPQYGTRYWYPAIVPLTLFVGYGVDYLMKRLDRQKMALLLAPVFIWQGYALHKDLGHYANRNALRNTIKAHIDTVCPPESIVLLSNPTRSPPGWPSFFNTGVFGRNFLLEGPRFYVEYPRKAEEAVKLFPHYSICRYELRIPDAQIP